VVSRPVVVEGQMAVGSRKEVVSIDGATVSRGRTMARHGVATHSQVRVGAVVSKKVSRRLMSSAQDQENSTHSSSPLTDDHRPSLQVDKQVCQKLFHTQECRRLKMSRM